MFSLSRRRWLFVVLLLFATRTAPAQAAEFTSRTAANPSNRDEPVASGEPDVRFQTVVHGDRASSDITRLTRETLEQRPAPSIGPALATLPGVSAIRKAADSTQLVLRGLSGERVRTTVAGVPVFGACPAQMDPPVTYFAAHSLDYVDLSLDLSPVTRGAAGLGSGVGLSLDYERLSPWQPELHGTVDTTYDSARTGGQLAGAVYGGTSWIDARGSASFTNLYDYHSGDGTRVPARFRQTSAVLSVGLRPHDDHRLQQALVYRRDADIDFPALPMDNIDTDFWLYSAAYRWDLHHGALRRVALQAGFSRVDHLMDNRYKANRPKLQAETPAESTSYAASARFDLRLAPSHRLSVGTDVWVVGRDALRTRYLVDSGKTFVDHLWPDAQQWDLGAFVQHKWHLDSDVDLRTGVRADVVGSAARAADDPSLGGLTVREQYVRFNGPEAAQVDRTEAATAANLLAQWRPEPWLATHLGAGLAMRPAGVTERYFAFGPAPGGFQIGNPTLAAEKKVSGELGVLLRPQWITLRAAAHYAFVDDFILETIVERRDVNGDDAIDPVRGFFNVAAHLVGFELRAELRPLSWLIVPLDLSYVRGFNATDGRDLPQIPPLEGSVAARVVHGQAYRWWAEVGTRFAAPQRFIDEEFGETETDGFALLHLRAGLSLRQRFRLEVVAENLLNTEYREHLTRPALLPSGDLQAGQPIPAPGRRILVSVQANL